MANYTGGPGNDSFTGSSGDDVAMGRGGDDILNGLSGNDQLDGEEGNDQLYGGPGTDVLNGGDGNDMLFVDSPDGVAGEQLNGGAGTDTLSAQGDISGAILTGIEVIDASGGGISLRPDQLAGIMSFRASYVNFTAGGSASLGNYFETAPSFSLAAADTTLDFTGATAAGGVRVTGNSGNDTIIGGIGLLLGVNAGEGNDTVSGGNYGDMFYGQGGNDRLSGGGGDDMLEGEGGDDVLEGGAGKDRLAGLSGTDTASYANATGAVRVDLFYGASAGAAGFDIFVSIENLVGSGFGDELIGDDGANLIEGGAGADVLRGLGGDDRLDGGAGNDIMEGGAGDDTFLVDSFSDQIVELAGGGIDTIVSSASMAFLANQVENLIVHVGPAGQPLRQGLGNALNNVLTGIDAVGSTGVNLFGDAGDDSIYGSSGDDFLFGGGDNDLLDGGAGQDTMAGGTGNDTYIVDMLNDGLSEMANEGVDTVRTALGAYVLGANLEQLIYSGTGGFAGTGNGLANTIDARSATAHVSLSGLEGTDVLHGGAFHDTLDGGNGADILYGGAGNDLYVVDSSLDQIVELAGGGTDTVESSSSFTLGSEVENLLVRAGAAGQPLRSGTGNALDNVLTGTGSVGSAGVALFGEAGSDTINGSGSDDLLWGGDDNDIVRGGDGNDVLNGGSGNDDLRGGAGDDRYVVDSSGDQVVEVAGEGIDTVESTISYTLGANLENLIISSAGADRPFNEGTGNELDNVLTGVNAAGFTGVSLNGEGGNDTIYGTSGTDFINGGSGDDIIHAGDGFNLISGGSGNDKMYGGANGDEFVVHDAGDMVFDAVGGSGDFVDVFASSWVLTAGQEIELLFALGDGSGTVDVSGNEFGQRIEGVAQTNILNGFGGNDELRGFTGNDQLSGGDDDDTLRGGAGEDTLNGDDGNDTLYGEADADTLNGGVGNDTLDGGTGGDTMDGGTGDDVFLVDDGGDFAFEAPGEGNDRVVASVSWTMTADQEIETLVTSDAAGTGAINFTGNSAHNRIEGNAGVNVLLGAEGNDKLFGFAGNDELRGGADNDTLDGGTGDDAMYGGAGHDIYIVDSSGDQVIENANEGQDTVRTSLNSYTLTANVEDLNALAGIVGTFVGSGNAGGNRIDASLTSAAFLYGYGSNDRLIGGNGNDQFYGGEGVDTITAGGGDDQIFVQNVLESQIGEVVDGGAGADSIIVSGSGQINIYPWTISNVERLEAFASAVGVSTSQYNGFSEIYGNIRVADGGTISLANKTVNGTLTLNGDGYTVNLGGVITSGLQIVGGSGNDTFNGSAGAGVLVQGGAGGDQFNGGSANDSFEGGAGNDWLDGGTGADTLAGGVDDDTYVVDHYGDTVVEALNEGVDTVRTSLMGYALGANVENLIYTGSSPFSGIGNDRANTIDATATATNDLMRGMGGDDTLEGGDGNDTLDGGLGKDILRGGAGNDVLEIGIPPDLVAGEIYDGGAGNDTLRIVGLVDLSSVTLTSIEKIEASSGVRLTVAQADALTGFTGGPLYLTNSGTVSFADFFVQGSLYLSDAPGNNVTLGTNQLTVYGGVSDDIITGGANRLIDGGAGNDTLTGSNGFANHLRGGIGNDKLTGGDRADTLVGGAGIDDVSGGAGDDTIQFLNANEVAAGDKMDGGTGYDVLSWIRTAALDISATTITGIEELRVADPNAGVRMTTAQFAEIQRSDTVIEFTDGGTVSLALKHFKGVFRLGPAATVFNGASTIVALNVQGGAGDDKITGGQVSDTLSGGNGADELSGMGSIDSLYGNEGNDRLWGGAELDMLYGGIGDDTYIVDDGDQLFENAGEGFDTASTALASLTLAANVEQLLYTGSGAFAGTGNDGANVIDTRSATGNDTLKGLGGADTLYAGAGNDGLDGGTGSDAMYGGAGDDTYYVDDANDQAIELSGEGSDAVRSTATSYTLGANIETLILTGAAKNGTGNALDNLLIGNGGHNILDGAAGADRMEGGLGDDTYRVDNANDLIVETGVGLDKAIASVSYTLRAGVSVETLTTDNDAGSAAINLTGNELANRVVGNAGANTLHGGGGNDRLEGLDGSDILWGDAGTDLLIGGNGNDLYAVTDLGDTIVETATGGVDRVSLSLATGGVFTLGAYVETLVVAGNGVEAHGNAQDNQIVNTATNSSLWGEGGNDTLVGGAVAEVLHGGTGNDRITGGAGNDTMWGEAGSDLFVFAAGSGADEVVDFVRGADKIDLTGYGITSFAQVEAMLSQLGADAVIDLGGGNSITLDNIVGSQLAASDFVFGF